MTFFLITSIDFNIDFLKDTFINLKLNVLSGFEVVFLDLNIRICKITNVLKFSLYIKPTNTFSYLITSSNHPKFIFKNIVKSLFIRIRRICSDFSDYLYFSRLLTFQLQKRGYSNNEICFNSRLISKEERNHLIPYKTKNSDYLGNCIIFKIPFEKNLINLDMILKNTFQTVSASVNFLKDKKFKTLFKINPNITS